MSIYSASVTTTPILKSANTSINRKRVHEKIRNSVQFQLISENGLRKVLEDTLNGINLDGYKSYIQAMRDVDLSDPDFGVLIKESRQCIDLLKPELDVFVRTIISLNWVTRSEPLIIEYQAFLIDLLSEHNEYTSYALHRLIQFWIPNKMDEMSWKNGIPDERIKFFLNFVHRTLARILEVIPMANDFAIEVIEKQFPYYTKAPFVVTGFVFNMLWLIEYRPIFREDILMLLLKNMVMMDVSLRRQDIEAAERRYQDAEETFKMDEDDIKSFEQYEMHLPLAETIDICMERLLHYITSQCKSTENEMATRTDAQAGTIYRILLKGFEQFILPTHKTNHMQFVIFYFCSMKASIVDSFTNYLCMKIWDPNVPATIRQSSVSYIASLLTRGKFISQHLIKQILENLCHWAHDYIKGSGSNQNTTSLKVHLVFYAVCEAIFYVIAFRSYDLTNSDENLKFLQSLQLSTLVTSHLNPLRVCSSAVATAFAGVTRAHQLAYCHTILERNARRKMAMVYQNEIIMPDETLDTMFPFDPYLLSKSGKFIADIYQCYKSNEKNAANDLIGNSNEVRRRKRVESLSLASSVDDNDFLTDGKRYKLGSSHINSMFSS